MFGATRKGIKILTDDEGRQHAFKVRDGKLKLPWGKKSIMTSLSSKEEKALLISLSKAAQKSCYIRMNLTPAEIKFIRKHIDCYLIKITDKPNGLASVIIAGDKETAEYYLDNT